MGNIETDLIIKAISQGFDKVSKDMKDLGKAGDEVEKGTDKASKGIGAFDVALGNLASGALQMATEAIVDFVKGSIKAASDVEEMQGKFTIVFKETADAVEADLARMAEATGASKFELMGFAATLQDTFVPLGFAREEAADMSTQLVQLAVDLASFNNLNTADVVRDLQSALVGNTETLRKYGVVAQETQIKAEALSLGLWDGTGAIDAQSKASAILSLTLKGTADAQGDAERTADSYANQQRALESAILDLQVAIGQELIPTMLVLIDVAKEATDALGATFQAKRAREELSALGDEYEDLQKAISNLAAQNLKDKTIWEARRIEAQLTAAVLELIQAGVEGTTEEMIAYAQAAMAADMRAEAMNDAFRDQVIATEEVTEATKEMSDESSAAIPNMAALRFAASQNEEQFAGLVEQLGSTEAAYEFLNAVMNDAGQASDEYEVELEELVGTTTELTRASASLMDGLDLLEHSLEELGEQTFFVSNLNQQQSSDLGELQGQYNKAAEAVHDYEVGIKGLGLSEEERNEKIQEQLEIMGQLEPLIGELTAAGGEYITTTNSATFNQGALNQALYDAAEAAGVSAEGLAFLAYRTGLLSEEQVEAALKAAAMQDKIAELGQLISEGMGIQEAINLLDEFQDQLSQEYTVKVDVADALAKLNELQNSADVLGDKLGGLGGPETTPAPTAGGGTTGGGGAPYDPGASPTGGPIGGQHGLDMIVPPGFPNDSFPIVASSGERVTIQTQGQQRGGRGGGVNMSVIINEPMNGNPFVAGRIMGEQFANKLGVRG